MKDDNLPNRLIALMSDGGWHSTEELVEKVSHRFSATMYVLKKRGYKFDKRRIEAQQHEYRLVTLEKAIA